MLETWFFDVLAYRPVPYPGECLSGYLLRLADVNGFTIFWDLVQTMFPAWDAPKQKLKLLYWEYPVEDWGNIPHTTHLPRANLECLTVAPWVAKFTDISDMLNSKYLSPGHFLRDIVHAHLQTCPLCLQEKPFLRLIWRLQGVSVCLTHGCELQSRCPQCGQLLSVVSPNQQYLRCSGCGMDLRQSPVRPVATDLLTVQQRQQAAFHFLLDPKAPWLWDENPNLATSPGELARALGLKFRYLRTQGRLSVAAMAKQVGVIPCTLSTLELGKRGPLLLYLKYLETLKLSWEEFAAVHVPTDFIERMQDIPHLSLRLCPTPTCQNHHPHLNTRIHLLVDIPERQIVRFRCTSCGRSFTRSYDGRLVTKPRRPPIRPGDPPSVVKPEGEIARLIEMGLHGENNRQIAHHLGWGEKTVRMYWISLDLKDQVHSAQAQRRAREKQARDATIQNRLKTILDTLLLQDEEITLRQVSQALGFNCDYLHTRPELAKQVRNVVGKHNSRVKQKKAEAVQEVILQALEQLPSCNQDVKIEEIMQQAGLTYTQFYKRYPELHKLISKDIAEHRNRLKILRIETQIQQIETAAVQLIARGVRLNYKTILREAGLSVYSSKNPHLQEVLLRWVGNFAPRD